MNYIDTATGIEKWAFYTEGSVRCCPTFWKNQLFFGSDDGNVYCLNAKNGTLIWKFRADPFDDKVLGNGRGSCEPLMAEIAPDSLKDQIKERLYDEIKNSHKGHIATGLVGVPVFTEWARVNTTKDTPYGTVSVKWKRENGNFGIDIIVPSGCTASIKVPSGGHNCKLKGKHLNSNQSWLSIDNGVYNLNCNQ